MVFQQKLTEKEIFQVNNSSIKKIINCFYSLNSTKLVILGNQKSGTTAIASLLAEASNQSVLLDSKLLWEPNFSKLKKGELSLSKLINSNKSIFSKNIIKEPNLTFLYDQLKNVFPKDVKYLFIVRDPRSNIRSILDRINTRGDLKSLLLNEETYSSHELALFDKETMNYTYDHYIEQLAERWTQSVELYLANKSHFHLIRYEDFLIDKKESIISLCQKLDFSSKIDIASKIDIQYQPKGKSNMNWKDFFGTENLYKINRICSKCFSELDYNLE